jgi:hypothetical protein
VALRLPRPLPAFFTPVNPFTLPRKDALPVANEAARDAFALALTGLMPLLIDEISFAVKFAFCAAVSFLPARKAFATIRLWLSLTVICLLLSKKIPYDSGESR